MRFRVLGSIEAEIEGSPVPLVSARQRALLVALLLVPGSVVSTDRLADAVWGEQLPAHPNSGVHNVVARLRRTLSDDGRLIATKPAGYVLTADPFDIDAQRFEAGYRDARSLLGSAPARAVVLLDAALALWRGPAYDDPTAAFAAGEARRLDELRLGALEDRVAAALAAGDARDAIGRAQALAAADPLRERPTELLMRALAADGRAGEALAAYRRHRATVEDELGLDPSEAMRDLERRVLRQELGPAGPARPAATSPTPRPAVPAPRQAAPGGPAEPADGTLREAAAPRVRPQRRLPWRPSSLLGRDEELRMVLRDLGSRGLVTLVGPGGVGKTRLALEVAHELAGRGETVWWVDLVPVRPDRVVGSVAQAIGVDVADDDEPAEALSSALAALRGGVVCLDNAEHVLAPVASLLERLLAETPAIRVLVTSRERLAIDEEAVRTLSPLPLPEGADRHNPGVALFLRRWAPERAEPPTEDEVDVAADICRHLDGLPLAIELGAAQATTLGLDDVRERLGDRLDLLTGGRRTALPRHRTLRAVLDWSHDLLSPEEAALFARLAVFPGRFSLAQAEAVCSDARLPRRMVAPHLTRLVEQSLVQRVQGRYAMLETLRHYAAARLRDGGEHAALARRHARDTADRLAAQQHRLWSRDEAAASSALTALVDDLHAAWAHARVHDRALAVRLAADVYDFAYYRQHRDLMDWGLEAASWDVDHPRLPDALATAATAAWTRGRLDEAWRLATRGVALAGGEDAPGAVPALDVLADLTMFVGRSDDAVARYLQAAGLHAHRGRPVEALCSRIAARQAMAYGDGWAEADRDLEGLRNEANAAGCPSVVAFAWFATGEAAVHTDPSRARRAYIEAIEHGSTAGSRLFAMIARASLLAIVARHDPREAALAAFEEALERWEQLGNEALQWWTLLSVVVLLERLGAARDAAVLGGAVVAARERRPAFAPDTERLEAALTRVRERLGPGVAAAALAEGAALPFSAVVTLARDAIRRLSARGPAAVAVPSGG